MLNKLQIVYPAASALSNFIYCYYIIEDTEPDYRNLHYSFPHTLNAVTIYNNGIFMGSTHHIKITGNKAYAPFCILQGKRLSPLLVDLEGKFSRITILFKPLGLNHFIRRPLGNLLNTDTSLFTEWQSPAFNKILQNLFAESKIHQRIALLENYLLSVLQPINLSETQHIITHLSSFNYELSVEAIAGLMNMSVRTLNRSFKTHVGVSPVVYRQIVRFRNSLEHKLFHDTGKRLTEIGYGSNFYDQSYFVKFYKQLAGASPAKFFNSVNRVGNSDLVFQFIENQIG